MNGTANLMDYANFQDTIRESFGGTKKEIPSEYKKRSAEFWPQYFMMPVAITTGGKDTIVPPQSVLRLASAIKQFQPNVLVISRDQAGHSTTYQDAKTALEFVVNKMCEKMERDASPAVVNSVVRSPLRETLSLDGPWDFAIDPKLEGEAAGWQLPEKSLPSPRQIIAPGCWESQGVGEPGLSSMGKRQFAYEPTNVKLKHAYTDAAWYKKTIDIPAGWAGKQMWLKIGGINAQGWIWVNGRFIAHDWSYCGTWKYNVTDLLTPGQKATIAVLARNDLPGRRGESNCMRTYGGLLRGVEFEATPTVSIDYAFVEPLFDQHKARLHVMLRNSAASDTGKKLSIQAKIATAADGQTAGEAVKAVLVAAGATIETTMDVGLDPFRSWSPESPSLYTAELTLKQGDKPIDGWVERFGMKKFEVRGGDYYLNNVRYFLRNCGDDHVYATTVCSPASREEHIKHLRIMKQYGFNYVRLHTHCEIPEYFEAADEVGMMIQPELPYYGKFGETRPYSHMSGAPLSPEDDLRELIGHMRRYTSLAVYCGGNEGTSPMPRYTNLFKLAKSLDPSRPWLNMDGGQNNTRENSEVNHGGYGWEHAPLKDNSWPFVRHEYMSFGINEDPRLEPKFNGAFAPNQNVQEVKRFVTEQVGLDWNWAEACFDAGHRLQGIWHKIGLEAARIDPYLDGFSCWLMIDLSPSTQCGVLDMFWDKKWSTPEYFRQFNAPTVVLAKTVKPKTSELLGLNPATLIYTEGDALDVDWVVSHFQPQALANATLVWRLVADEKTLANGKIEKIDVAAGAVPIVGRSRITMPGVKKAVRARLVVDLEAAQSHNSWNIWILPKFTPQPDGGKGMAVSAGAFDLLATRYPGLAKLGTVEAGTAALVIARDLKELGVLEALTQGKSVICLSLPGYNLLQPGTELAAWQVSNQTGTAIATHPAFGDFPNSGYLDQGWFRLVDKAEKLDPGHKFRTVEPLMIGIGRATGYAFGTLGYPLGFNLYAFQARAGQGKLLASGLNLANGNPEAVYLLDQFIRYARSEKFAPQGTFDIAQAQQTAKQRRLLGQNLNGWTKTLESKEKTVWQSSDQSVWQSFLCSAPICVVRQTNDNSSVAWRTGSWKPDDRGLATFRWAANLGWRSQPAGGRFSLFLNNEKLLDFDISLASTTWKNADGSVVLKYTVKSLDRDEDSSGIMELTVPSKRLQASDESVTLRVDGSGPNSRRYFGLFEICP